jgi:hypothetical protein
MQMSPIIFQKEQELLISCAKLHLSKVQNKGIFQHIQSEIDEQKFLNLIDRHALAPIVFHCFHDDNFFSDDLNDKLKVRVVRNQVSALNAVSLMIRLQKKMDEERLKGVFLKGIPLASVYYGDIGLRHCGDIDLWVEKKGFPIISAFLTSLGYRSNFEISDFNDQQIAYKYKTDHHIHFTTKDPSLPPVIELHWKLRGRFGFFSYDPESSLTEFSQVDLGGIGVNVLGHIDNFLFLCSHGTEHAWYRLKWLCDIPQMINYFEFDWNKVYQRAIELDCFDQVRLTFLVLNRVLKQEIPIQFRCTSWGPRLRFQLSHIEHCINYDGLPSDTFIEKARSLSYFLSINQKGFFNQTLFLRYLTSERDWKTLRLPENLFFLYFPLRPFLFLYRLLFVTTST